MRDTSRHRRRAARRHHGDRRRRPRSRRIHPQRAEERDRAHHPAHRPARPGAGAPRHRRLRHQRLQGEDRAHRRQAVHLADRGAAQLSAARAHGADPARPRDHHRRGLDAVRFQIDAAARRRRADADRLAAQRRLRRHPGAARRRRGRQTTSRCWPAPAATAASSAPPVPSRSIRICGRWSKTPSGAASTNSPIIAPCSMSAPAAAARSWCCCRPSAICRIPIASLVEIFGSRLSIAFDNVILYQQLQEANTQLEDRVAQRTRALMQANRRLSAQWLRLQRANGFKNEILGTVAHDLKNPLGVILGRTEMLTELIGAGSPKENVTAQVDHIRDATKRLTAMVDHLISDAMADAFDITIRREPVDVAALVGRGRRGQPAARPSTSSRPSPSPRRRARHHVRRRPDARGDRQSRQQRHQVHSDRRQDHGAASPMRRQHRHPRSPTGRRACRRKISAGCSAVSSDCPPSRPAAKARPASACRSSNASSTCMAAM